GSWISRNGSSGCGIRAFPACRSVAMRNERLHVVQISFFVDPQHRAPSRLLRDWPTLVDVAEAAQRGGVRVSVVQACSHSERLTCNGVEYHFFAADPAA